MLDIEVILVVEDGNGFVGVISSRLGGGAVRVVAALGRDGDGGEVDLLRHDEVRKAHN